MAAHDGSEPATACDPPTESETRPDRAPHATSLTSTEPQRPRIIRADNGLGVPLQELVRSGEHALIWSIDEKMRLTWHRATGRVQICDQYASLLRLTSGRQLEFASEHLVLTIDGWKSVASLGVGSRLAVVRRLPEPIQPKPMNVSEIIMLAHMIGDGSCVKRQPVRYASVDEANLAAVTIAAAHFGVSPTARR
jgi:replicative DNA helicase